MSSFWGYTKESKDAAKKTIEQHLHSITTKKGQITVEELIKLLWNDYHLFEHYLKINIRLEELEDEAKIVIDSEKNLRPAKMTILEAGQIKEINVWDFYHKKEQADVNKKIIERYKNINYLT
jgi:hypothetical protein